MDTLPNVQPFQCRTNVDGDPVLTPAHSEDHFPDLVRGESLHQRDGLPFTPVGETRFRFTQKVFNVLA